MLLAKRCYKKDNIKNGTIKLGTLHEYRHTEIQQIADKEEGVLRFKIFFEGEVKIKLNWFHTLFGEMYNFGPYPPILFPGTISAHLDVLNLVKPVGDSIIVRDSSSTITRQALNSFIFCMSYVRKTHECAAVLPHYDDYWYMTFNKAEHFGVGVGKILLEKIKKEHAAGNYILPKETNLDTLLLNVSRDIVTYTTRDIHITNQNPFDLDELVQQMSDMTFVKPPIPFQNEKEYRFQYTFLSDGNIVVPNVKFVILDASTLQDFIV